MNGSKVIVVTGGSRGIGAEIVKELAKDGYNVILNYNKYEEAAMFMLQPEDFKNINIPD